LDIFAGAETEGVMEEIQQQTQKEEQKHREEEEEEEEGPPPGWESAVLPPPIVTITAAVNPNPTTVEIPGILVVLSILGFIDLLPFLATV